MNGHKFRTWSLERLPQALLAIIVVGALCHAYRYRDAVIDDSFITFRHSLNLAHGHGFSCNSGERIEGTSAPLFALLIFPFLALGADPFTVATAVGALSFGAMCVLAFLLVRDCLGEERWRWSALGAAVLVASSAPIAFHSQTGMETTTSAALVMFGLWLQQRNLLNQRSSLAWAIVMGLGVMLRTEVALYFLTWLVLAQISIEPWKFKLKRAGRELVAFCATLLPLFLFRFVYFGTLIPNSVLAKSGKFANWFNSPTPQGVGALLRGDGTDLLVRFASQHALLFALVPGCLLVPRARRLIPPLAVLVLAGAALINWSDGDWMPNFRHLVPCLAPLAVGTMLGIRGILFRDAQRGEFGHLASALMTVGIVLFTATTNAEYLHERKSHWDLGAMRTLGRRLAQHTRISDWLATDSAGILPFYWGINIIDNEGLCNGHIARNGQPQRFGIGRKLTGYVVSRHPDWYAFEVLGGAMNLYETPDFGPFRDDYLLLRYPKGYLASSGNNPHLPVLLVRKNRPENDSVAASLGVELVPFKAVAQHLYGNDP